MTKTIITSYFVLLLLAAFGLVGIIFAQASEVTGTLSSDASSNSTTDGNISGTVSSNNQTSGNISGTVTGGSNGGGGGGSRSNGGGSSNSSSPDGAVLGASTDTGNSVAAPSFPNAGFGPAENPDTTFVSKTIALLLAMFKNAISF